MSLSNLPDEILELVAEYLLTLGDLCSFSRVSRRFWLISNPLLYRLDALEYRSSAMVWGARHGIFATLERSLRSGGNINTFGTVFPVTHFFFIQKLALSL
jgi:hypothetical protein